MIDVSCKLVSYNFTQDEIGNETVEETLVEIPIIRVEDVYADEFYKASQQGLRPTLRLRISSLNYNNERELEYIGNRYTVIRTQELMDETILICERKVNNGIGG